MFAKTMNTHFLNSLPALHFTVLFLLFNVFTARADIEDKITNSFQVQPGGQLVVEVDRGSIDVKTMDRDSVEIEVIRKARGSDAKARNAITNHVVTMSRNDNKVVVHAEYTGHKTSGWFRRSPDLQVRFVITVPRRFDADLQTAGGHINVAELTGKLTACTSGGHLKFEKIEGPISARTSGGSINLANCKGAVEAITSGGHLDLSGIEGDIDARTSGGCIEIEDVTGKSVVTTSGGHIKVAGIKGSIEARTSGGGISAALIEQPTANCSFRTSGGSITIAIGAQTAVDVDLHTSAGGVSTDFPVTAVIQGEQKKNELRGKINGGGPLITAHTSAGSIRLRKK